MECCFMYLLHHPSFDMGSFERVNRLAVSQRVEHAARNNQESFKDRKTHNFDTYN